MTLSRRYVPAIGKRVTLRNFADYHANGIECVWAHLEVKSITGNQVETRVLNGMEPTGQIAWVPLSSIAPPIGWAPRYTIHCKPDQVENVLSWLTRGIIVRASHDLSNAGAMAFQPMDNSAQPHWQFCEVTDAVPAAECGKVFRVVKVEREDVYDAYLVPDTECEFCHGTGKRHLQTIADVRKASFETVLADSELLSHLENYDAETHLFTCHCIRGGFRRFGRTKRAKLIKEWAREGWNTHYVNLGEHSYWERTRETVVKDWES